MSKLTQVGDFCPNETCSDYGKCQGQGQHYRRRTSDEEILDTLALIAEGNRISSLVRTKGHKEDTIIAWIRKAGQHAEKIERVLLADYHLSRGQIDYLWAYVGHKREKKVSGNG
jgi:hypothetical protein